ncbi:MAG: hypothetical protein ACRDRF_19810, partial [Pseudonocardiaceae bacterium]
MTSASGESLRLEAVSKRYAPGGWVLRKVDLEIPVVRGRVIRLRDVVHHRFDQRRGSGAPCDHHRQCKASGRVLLASVSVTVISCLILTVVGVVLPLLVGTHT